MILMEIIYTFLMVAVQFPIIVCVIGIAESLSHGSSKLFTPFLIAFPVLAPCIIGAESLSLYQLQKLVKAGYFGLIALKNAVEAPDEIGDNMTEYFGGSTALFFVRWFYMFIIFLFFTIWISPKRDRTDAEYLKWKKEQTPGTDLESGRKTFIDSRVPLTPFIMVIGSPLVAWYTEPFTTNSYIAIGSCLSLILLESLFVRFVCPTPAHEKKK